LLLELVGKVTNINMNQTILTVIAGGVLTLCVFIFAGIWASRYARVGPNQALIVSGRKIPRPDGTFVNYRIVKGGGTFVWPVLETVAVLSLEVRAIEMPGTRVRASKGEPVELDCVAQVKIKGDDASIAAAAEHFLSKNDEEMKSALKPILEKHLALVLGDLSGEELNQRPEACAAKVQSAAAADLNKMGLEFISLSIRNVRAA
jgi:flotillin